MTPKNGKNLNNIFKIPSSPISLLYLTKYVEFVDLKFVVECHISNDAKCIFTENIELELIVIFCNVQGKF